MRTISDKLKTTIEIKEDQKKYLQEENPEVDLNTLPFKEYINLFKKTPIDNSHSEKGSNLSEKVNILSDTKNKQKEYLQQKYPNLDLNSIPFRSYLSLFKDEYVDGIIARYECYDGSNEKEEALGLNAKHYLKDLTGHGHDIELFNFGWSEGSGYGKYAINLNDSQVFKDAEILDKSNNKVTFSISRRDGSGIFLRANNKKSFKIKIKGLEYNDSFIYRYYDGQNITFIDTIKNNGVVELSPIPQDVNLVNIYFNILKTSGEIVANRTITIEQIPEYQGALVSDGVDDYGLCENFPILENKKGYTILAIRKWYDSNIILDTNLAGNTQQSYNDGAFAFDDNPYTTQIKNVNNFGASIIIQDIPDLFCYQTSKQYNKESITKGANEGKKRLTIFSSRPESLKSAAALYSLEIYDHDLTDEEIEKVRQRMLLKYYKKTGLFFSLDEGMLNINVLK